MGGEPHEISHWLSTSQSFFLDRAYPHHAFCDPARTAVHLAARGGHVEVLKVLLEEQSDEQKEYLVNQPDRFGITPVFLTLQKYALYCLLSMNLPCDMTLFFHSGEMQLKKLLSSSCCVSP